MTLAPSMAAFDFLESATISTRDFAARVVKSGLVARESVESTWKELDPGRRNCTTLAVALAARYRLTPFQAQSLLEAPELPLVLGDYVIEDKLGAGGMGTVYSGMHKLLKRDVALKVLLPETLNNENAIRRFRREIEVGGQLSHPNIVTVHDAGQVNGHYYLAMERVIGRDLQDEILNHAPMSIPQALNCVLQAAQGIAFAHSRQIIHRDIKPSNMLIDIQGRVKVIDWGLARLAHSSDSEQVVDDLTHSGVMMGTIDFMSPEQAIDCKTADTRSDIYSLGCTLFFVLTRRALYLGDTPMKRLLEHRELPIPKLVDYLAPIQHAELVNVGLQPLFELMVAKRPEQRLSSMDQVVTSLEQRLQQFHHGNETIRSGAQPTRITVAANQQFDATSETDRSANTDETIKSTPTPPPLPHSPRTPLISQVWRRRLLFAVSGITTLALSAFLALQFVNLSALLSTIDTFMFAWFGSNDAQAIPIPLAPDSVAEIVDEDEANELEFAVPEAQSFNSYDLTPMDALRSETPAAPKVVISDIIHQTLTIKGWCGSWSRDGRSLLVNVGRVSPTTSGALLAIEIDTHREIEIAGGAVNAAWSPAGRQQIAYTKSHSIFVYDLASKQERKIAAGDFPSWSADGETLYYFTNREVVSRQVNAADNQPRYVYTCDIHSHPSVSPDGKKICYRYDDDYVVANLKTGAFLFSLSVENWIAPLAGWSSDSTYVAVADDGTRSGVWIINTETRQSSKVLDNDLTYPRWSLDGRYLSCDHRSQNHVHIFRIGELDLPK